MRALVAATLGLGLLSGCGTASFSTPVAVTVDSRQEVAVFDPLMGQSEEWARSSMGEAAPKAPYTTQLTSVESKLIFDSGPPASLGMGLYLPAVTMDGYFAIDLRSVSEGAFDIEAPFVQWYTAAPGPDTPDSQPLEVRVDRGPEGWVVTIAVVDT